MPIRIIILKIEDNVNIPFNINFNEHRNRLINCIEKCGYDIQVKDIAFIDRVEKDNAINKYFKKG